MNPPSNMVFGIVKVEYCKLFNILLKFVGLTNSLKLSLPNFNLFSIGTRIGLYDSILNFLRISLAYFFWKIKIPLFT